MPNGTIDVPIVEDNFDGTVRIQYNPKEDGVHEMILLKDGAPVQGKYFSILFIQNITHFKMNDSVLYHFDELMMFCDFIRIAI